MKLSTRTPDIADIFEEMHRILFDPSRWRVQRRHLDLPGKLVSSGRKMFSEGSHLAAQHKLETELATIGSSGEIESEIVRMHLALGDWNSALSIFTHRKAAGARDNGPIGNLLSIQEAFINIFVNGNLLAALQLASSMWKEMAETVSFEEIDEICVRCCYYCLEINDVWKRYGDGSNDPNIMPSDQLLELLTIELAKLGLYFEVLELLEYHWDNAEHPIEAFIDVLPTEAQVQKTDCLHRLARLHAKQRDYQNCESSLARVAKGFLRKNHMGRMMQDYIRLRYLDQNDAFTRVKELVRLSEMIFNESKFSCAMQVLEEAAELHCELPATSESFECGVQIHNLLSKICHQSGDNLSLMQFEFRRCDMMNSLSNNYFEARRQRDELLSSSFVEQVTYFQRYYERQWRECFLLHQRGEALHYAEKYLEYCKKFRDERAQSLAGNLCIQSKLLSDRRSEESREALLQRLQFQLEQGITYDRATEHHVSQLDKLLLLVEVSLELCVLQEESLEDGLKSALLLLDEAETLCSKISFTQEDLSLKTEAKYLRISLFLATYVVGNSMTNIPIWEDVINTSDDQPFETAGFFMGEFMRRIAIAIQNDSKTGLQQLLNTSEEEAKKLKSKCHPLKWAQLLLVQAFVHYTLAVAEGEAAHSILQASTIDTPDLRKRKALDYLQESLSVKDSFLKETPNRDLKVGSLVANQAFVTEGLETPVFQFAITISYELSDSNLLWMWAQRWKARAFSRSLANTLGGNYQHTSFVDLPDLTFEDMRWVSSASTREIVFVDWVPYGMFSENLMLLAWRFLRGSKGRFCRTLMAELGPSNETLREAKRRLSPARLDEDDSHRVLEPFQAVIEPLAEYTKEGELLILCPTGPLHNVPLHAVTLGQVPLIQRNPICYTSSLSALVTCLRKTEAESPGAESSQSWKAEIFGAYDDGVTESQVSSERSNIYSSLGALGERLGTKPIVGSDLSNHTFKDMAAHADLLHFHGHGRYDEHDPTSQSLVLGRLGESLTIFDIDTMSLNKAHVTLIACHGGVQDVMTGDEPLGLPSVFLLAGATSVLGAMWPVQSTTGRKFTKLFYDYFLDYVDRTELGPIVNLAMATQHAMLHLKKSPETQTPYHWAPFALYGSWFCRRKPGTW